MALLASAIYSCDDTTGSLGLDMLPGSDNVNVSSTSFDVTTKSILSGPVFAKTDIGYVGKYTDPDFGYFESGFLTQLNCTDSLQFPFGVMAANAHLAAELFCKHRGQLQRLYAGGALQPQNRAIPAAKRHRIYPREGIT